LSIKCPKCHSDNPDASRFCADCGTRMFPGDDFSIAQTETIEAPKEELTTGSTFTGRFQIIEELGKGGMGKVYKANDIDIKEKVAIKLIKPEISTDKKTIERFQNEIKFARKIRHKNVCQMYDLNREEGTYYITMEYVEGENLKNMIRMSGQLGMGTVISVAKQVCEGLAEAHKLGVVHRDLKPSNIMLDREGYVRIMDFGIARSLKEKGITGAGVMIGTPEYMSPEQVEGKETDQRSDIYSLGVILYEMVTGKVPFEGDTPFTIGVKHKSEIPKDPKELNSQIPNDLNRVIIKCLEKDKEKRYQSTDEVRSELENIEKGILIAEKVVTKRGPLTLKKKEERIGKSTWKNLFIYGGAAVLLILLIAGGYYLFTGWQGPIDSLAVLPLENLSGDTDQEFFADGMTEVLIANMAQIGSLRVISRKSVMRYKRSEKSLPEIAEELNVDAVLEGSVMRVGDKVRITVQLIQAEPEQHLWAENYERSLRDVLKLQSEVAQAIAKEIKIKLTPQEEARFASTQPVNPEAYQAYLRGIDRIERISYSEEDIEIAIQMFKRAVELDPTFALGYAELSKAHSSLYHQGYDQTEDRLTRARAAVDMALKLQPDLSEAHLALGYYYYWVQRAYDRALEEFIIAEKNLPNDPRILEAVAFIWRRQGNFEDGLSNLKRALEISPRDASKAFEVAVTYMALRRYPEAERYYDRSIFLEPDKIYGYVWKAWNYWLWDVSIEKARATLEEMPKKMDSTSMYYWFLQELYERNYKSALDRLYSANIESIEIQEVLIPKAQLVGLIYHLMNELEYARTSFDSARVILEKGVKERPEDARVHSSLGIVYAALGRKEEAIQEGEIAVELFPVSKDAFFGVERVEDLACIFTMVGDYDAALDKIEYLISIPSYFSVSLLQLDPIWEPLHNHPRFQRLLKEKK
jgi:serine/threonine protein kinase/tetratricopeptide (TPR) repeat protein